MRRVADVLEILRAILARGGEHDLAASRVVIHERRDVVNLACERAGGGNDTVRCVHAPSEHRRARRTGGRASERGRRGRGGALDANLIVRGV